METFKVIVVFKKIVCLIPWKLTWKVHRYHFFFIDFMY